MTSTHKWEFQARFRRNAFGWRSKLPIKRIRESVSEIKKVARKDKLLGAEGAIRFLERLSPAIEHVDSSSGSIGSAVNRSIAALIPIIANAPADASAAFSHTMEAAKNCGRSEEAIRRLQAMLGQERPAEDFIKRSVRRMLEGC